MPRTASGPICGHLHRPAQHERAPVDGLELEVLERPQAHDQEVAAPARGVEHPHAAQAGEEVLEHGVGVLVARRRLGHLAAGQQELGHPRLHRHELAAQRAQDHGLDELPDGVAVRVVGAQLGALVGVEAALEQGAEDRGLDERPVEPADLEQGR